jgi:uncharacterized membrane protein
MPKQRKTMDIQRQCTWYKRTFWIGTLLIVAFLCLAFAQDLIVIIGDYPLGDFVFWAAGLVLVAHLSLFRRLVAAQLGRLPVLGMAMDMPRQYRWYKRTFWIGIFLLVIFVCLAFAQDPIVTIGNHPLGDFVFWVAGLVLVAHLFLLGGLADQLNKSPALWVVFAFFFAPLGTIVAFVRISAMWRR